jgi:hypothetical protein
MGGKVFKPRGPDNVPNSMIPERATTSHVIAGHYLEECLRIEGRLEALLSLSKLGASLVGPSCSQSDDVLAGDAAIALAIQAVREAEREVLRYLRCQVIGLRDPEDAFAEYERLHAV